MITHQGTTTVTPLDRDSTSDSGVRVRSILIWLTMLALPLSAQQVGDADRDLIINQQGSREASFVATLVPTPGLLDLRYATSVASAPVVLAIAPTGQIGAFTTSVNSVDLPLSTLAIVLDGTSATGALALLTSTDNGGQFLLGVPVPASARGLTLFTMAAHTTSASPSGFFVSQTHALSLDAYCPQMPLVEDFSTITQRDVVSSTLNWNGTGRLDATPGYAVYGDGTAGAITFGPGLHEIDTSLVPTPSPAINVVSTLHVPGGVLQATSFTVTNGATVRVYGDFPLDIRCTGTVTVDGVLDGSAFFESSYLSWAPQNGQFNNGTAGGFPSVVTGGRGGPGAGNGGDASSTGVLRTLRGDAGEGPRVGGVPVFVGDPRFGGGEGGIGDTFSVPLNLAGGQGGAGGSARSRGTDALPLGSGVVTIPSQSPSTVCGVPIPTANAPALAILPTSGYGFPITSLLGGSGGGAGGDKFDVAPPGLNWDEQAGAGGGGGGALGITAAGAISISGAVVARGAAGSLGTPYTGAGGGGSGGMIWIRSASQVTFTASANLDVSGGSISGGVISCAGLPGTGGDGLIQVEDADGLINVMPSILPAPSSFDVRFFGSALAPSGTATSLFYDSGFDAALYRGVIATTSAPAFGSTIVIEVQGAQPDLTTPSLPSMDAARQTPWIPANLITNDPAAPDPLDGHRFVRFRVTMSWLGATPAALLPFVNDITFEVDGNLACP